MFWDQSTARDYIKAEGDFHKEIYIWKDRWGRDKTGRTERDNGEMSGEFMKWNTVERAIQTETDTRTGGKKSGQARLVYVRHKNLSSPSCEGQPGDCRQWLDDDHTKWQSTSKLQPQRTIELVQLLCNRFWHMPRSKTTSTYTPSLLQVARDWYSLLSLMSYGYHDAWHVTGVVFLDWLDLVTITGVNSLLLSTPDELWKLTEREI